MKAANNNVDIDNLHPDLIEIVNKIENELKQELIITSGFRDATHPVEARKSKPGTHYGDGKVGYAIDVAAIGGYSTYSLVAAAIKSGIKRLGINRSRGFVHLDIADRYERPVSIWTY